MNFAYARIGRQATVSPAEEAPIARPPRPGPSNAPTALAAAAVVVALAAFVHGVLRPAPVSAPRRDHVTALFVDAGGLPLADLVVVDAAGRDLAPDERGMLSFAAADEARCFEILDRETRRWLRAFTLHPGSVGVVRLTVHR